MKGAYPGIKTRRLGRRGNSKYHYIDIGPSIEIEARRLNEYDSSRGLVSYFYSPVYLTSG
jgi:hypothetical protein